MRKTFLLIIKKPKNIIFLISASILIFTILRFLPVYKILNDFYSLKGISWGRHLEVFSEYVFDPFFTAGLYEKISSIILSLLTSFNLLLFIIFAKKQKKFLSGKGFFATLSGIFLGFFGVGCISCGAFILAPIITFVGLGAYTTYFIEHANIIAALGIIFVIFSSIYLLKQIAKPMVCI